MGSLTLTQHVNAPVDVTFDVATDLPRAAEHIQGIDRIEMVTDGPVGVGTVWRETRTMFGRASTEEFSVVAFQRPEFYTASGVSCGAAFEFTFRFDSTGDGCEITLQMNFRPVSFFAKLMSPISGLMMGSMKKLIQQDLQDVKQAAEGRCETLL